MWSVTIFPLTLLLLLHSTVKGDDHPNLGLLPQDCGFINVDKASDSTYATLNEFPWMVRLYLSGQDNDVCHGTVVNERYVLTAGHCAVPRNHRKIDRIGVSRRQDGDCDVKTSTSLCEHQFQEIEIEETLVHKRQSMGNFDIALLRLKTPLDFSHGNVAPVCLPFTNELQNKSLVGQEAVIAGWEIIADQKTTSKIMKIKLPVKEFEECSSTFKRHTEPSICTADVANVCPMRSGSPLMLPAAVKGDEHRYVQYGITVYGSRDSPPCTSFQRTVYTDVSKLMDWIVDNLKA